MRWKLLVLLLLCYALPMQADVVLPAIFGDHMVLQRNAYIALWGRADPGEQIRFAAEWDEMNLSLFADSRGRWRIEIPTPEAGGPYRIFIQGKNQIVLRDILIGEVWLASGQSNMEWPLSRSQYGPEVLEKVDAPQIRVFQVEKDLASSPRFDCRGKWQLASPASLNDFSAVSYHFAEALQTQLGVPIGIIHTSWGGTPAETWMSREQLEEIPEFKPNLDRYDEAIRNFRQNPKAPNPTYYRNPTCVYNAMLAPLIPFEIRGVIWYQGESNRYDPQLYQSLFPALIQNWRSDWQRNLPFYFVQIAPYRYDQPMVGAGIREAQRITANTVSKTGMVVSLDVGDPEDIHPLDKRTIGQRLALQAMAKTYDQSVLADGPVLERIVPGTGYLDLYFAKNGSALDLQSEEGFVIAGADQKFYPAKVNQAGPYQLQLSSEQVANPVAVRYAFDNATEASLFNEMGLPATSFRTDDWPLFFGPAKLSVEYAGPKKGYEVGLSYPASQQHRLHYSLDGSEPSLSSPLYQEKLLLQRGQTIKVRAFADSVPSPYLMTNRFSSHLGMDAEILAQSLGEKQYPASGDFALVDGLTASPSYDDGRWRGYLGDTVLLELDLGRRVRIDSISTHFLQHQGIWVYGPASVEIAVSNNGKRFQSVLTERPDSEKAQSGPQILPFSVGLSGQKVRYIRLLATPISQLPSYHPGAGKAAWLFVDELIVK